jgi:hypothetical protein
MATGNDWRIVPETADLDIANEARGDTIAHWAVFTGGACGSLFGTFPSREAAEAAIREADAAGWREGPAEWDGRPSPEAPDTWWVDDDTGQYVRASDGARMERAAALATIAVEGR